jgi:hypothetical protein
MNVSGLAHSKEEAHSPVPRNMSSIPEAVATNRRYRRRCANIENQSYCSAVEVAGHVYPCQSVMLHGRESTRHALHSWRGTVKLKTVRELFGSILLARSGKLSCA